MHSSESMTSRTAELRVQCSTAASSRKSPRLFDSVELDATLLTRLSCTVGRPCTRLMDCTCATSRHLSRQPVCRADMRVVAIPGALRAGSTNNGLLRAAAQVLPSGMHMIQADYSQLPLYNDDLWSTGIPDSVKSFRDHIGSADALLFAVPEYNYSLPGPLKNAIDWASKNPNVFAGKPATMLGQCYCCSFQLQHVHAVPSTPPQMPAHVDYCQQHLVWTQTPNLLP